MKGQKGQATTEYILLLSISIGFLFIITSRLVVPAFKMLSQGVSNQIENKFFSIDFHSFPVKR